MIHILLKPALENFKNYLTGMWDECNCAVVWAFFGIAFLGDWSENWLFPVPWPLLSFQMSWHIECSTFKASSFRIWSISTGIPSPPLALFIVIIHLEPDILESEVKWVLGSITMNKASGGDGIPVELLQILKDDAVKVLHSICQQIWKTQQWPQEWKRSVFIPVPMKAMPKNAQTTTQLHSSHTLAK